MLKDLPDISIVETSLTPPGPQRLRCGRCNQITVGCNYCSRPVQAGDPIICPHQSPRVVDGGSFINKIPPLLECPPRDHACRLCAPMQSRLERAERDATVTP